MTIEDWLTLTGTLLIGLATGWLVHGWLLARRSQPTPQLSGLHDPTHEIKALTRKLQEIHVAVAERRQKIEDQQAELARVDLELERRNRALEEIRSRVTTRDKDHTGMLQKLGERRARVADVGADLFRLHQEMVRQEEKLDSSLEDITQRSHELDLLTGLSNGYQAEIDEVTQNIQLTDSKVARLTSVLEAKQQELKEAQTLLNQRDADLANLIQARQRTEHQIAEAEEQLEMVTGEHGRLLAVLREKAEDTDQHARLLAAMNNPQQYSLPLPSGAEHANPQPPRLDGPAGEAAARLTAINGIGEGYASMLHSAGIITISDLSLTSPEKIRNIIMAPHWRMPDVEAWIADSRAFAADELRIEQTAASLISAETGQDLLIEPNQKDDNMDVDFTEWDEDDAPEE